MTCTLIAQVVDERGIAAYYLGRAFGGRDLDRAYATPAATFIDSQPGDIGIYLGHDGHRIGSICFLEHGVENTDLRAVGVIDNLDADMVDGLYCSAEIDARMRNDTYAESCTLTGLALVASTAGVGATPCRAFPGDYRNRASRTATWPRILDRAATAWTGSRYAKKRAIQVVRPSGFEDRIRAGLEPISHGHTGTVLAVR